VPVDAARARGHRRRHAIVTILDGAQALTSATIVREIEDTAPIRLAGGRTRGLADAAVRSVPACGAHNPLGLQQGCASMATGFGFLPWSRRRRVTASPRPARGGLDEIAWWLGALSRRRRLHQPHRPTLLRPAALGPVTAVGRFADVTPVDRRRTFWRTRSALLAADGTLLATAAIVFRAGADYSERQMAFFRARTDPAIFERMFPNHAG
jgi:hypothetical protein